MNPLNNTRYYILSLNQKQVSLFRIYKTTTVEVHDRNFPISFSDDYEYARSSRGTSFGYALKNFEKDKSILKKERIRHFMKAVNEKLGPYLDRDSALLLAGTNEDRADFKKVSDYNNFIAGEISGSFNSGNLSQLKKLIFETIK